MGELAQTSSITLSLKIVPEALSIFVVFLSPHLDILF